MSSNLSLIELIELLRKSADELDTLQRQAAKDSAEIRKRDDIIDELRDENERLRGELAKRSKHSAERVELETN